MPEPSDQSPAINSWLEDELYQQYLHDRRTVDESWKEIFESNGHGAPAGARSAPASVSPNGVGTALAPVPVHRPTAGEELVPLKGAAGRLAENMTASLSIPVATSQRIIPVKVIDENRRMLNEQRMVIGKSKISYTHLIGWAIVRAVQENPAINHAFAQIAGESFRAVRSQINLGLAVDVAGKDGRRSLMVPSIKNAGALTFEQYLAAFDDIVARARTGKLTVADFEGVTISLTNPGTVGTFGSAPRLMPGQGAIIATGAIDYPAEYQGASPDIRARLGVGKVMMVTCTYDHRVIQGAESGMFLGRLQELLQGEHEFFDQIFSELQMPLLPARWGADHSRSTQAAHIDAVKQAAVSQLIHAYRVRGHLLAALDPLGSPSPGHPDLDHSTHGLTIWDFDREFLDANGNIEPLRTILERLHDSYAGRVGSEYMYIPSPEEKAWLQGRIEANAFNWPLDTPTRLRTLEKLIEAEEFEHFLHNRFVGAKRFSVEGGEASIAILDEILERATGTGVHEIVIGMAHRGRLNVLTNIVGKSMGQVFSEFEGNIDPDNTLGSGDVKYHLGATGVRNASNGGGIVVSVAFNPSHLEAVDPVVEGIVRPKQDRLKDTERARVIPILIHGDAAFAGQGVVAETLNMSHLEGYTTGGTIHLVINNQIGFTTDPSNARSGMYATDIARLAQAPIFHVNGDDAEACTRVAQLAYDYRQQFKKDVVIDLICYRRYGHNEADDPTYTQPVMYRKIREHASVGVLYAQRLTREKVIDSSQVEAMRKAINARLNAIYDASKQKPEPLRGQGLSAIEGESLEPTRVSTAVDRSALEQVLHGITSFPASFHLHPKLNSFIEKRKELLNGGVMDWATAETLAFGTLLLEGTPVRLSGQDTGRGTFSQRHVTYYDYESGAQYVPLQHLAPVEARFEVVDSFLSEFAVVGFEFGYSIADPLTLVVWEAQFGDFANGAQIVIDQFISSAESKWGQTSGLVLLLPHGYEGQGPEHSSARLERFLQLCAENNLIVANCSTPAQYFHILRRQMYGGPDRRGLRKPLILFTPKRMLRYPKAVSKAEELISGSFRDVLLDTAPLNEGSVRRVLICSGQVYYDLFAAREERKLTDVAILRLEQIYPFPQRELREAILRYPVSAEVVWVQEEPRNMGAWNFVEDQMEPILDGSKRRIRYAGRAEGASPAAGSSKWHQQEQAELVDEAFTPDGKSRGRRRR